MWAIVQRIYDDGKVKMHLRPAKDGEQSHHEERRNCDQYVDVFATEEEARAFAAEAREA
jgi:hypothetical protein